MTRWLHEGTEGPLFTKSPNHSASPALCVATLNQCANLHVELLLLLLVAKAIGPETHAVVPVQLCCVDSVAHLLLKLLPRSLTLVCHCYSLRTSG